jgi:hypothetical protein
VAVLREGKDTYTMEVLSEFLLVAAILIELKSQRLLPGPDDVDAEDELIGWQERDLLLSRLLECRAYAAVADRFVAMAEAAAISSGSRETPFAASGNAVADVEGSADRRVVGPSSINGTCLRSEACQGAHRNPPRCSLGVPIVSLNATLLYELRHRKPDGNGRSLRTRGVL